MITWLQLPFRGTFDGIFWLIVLSSSYRTSSIDSAKAHIFLDHLSAPRVLLAVPQETTPVASISQAYVPPFGDGAPTPVRDIPYILNTSPCRSPSATHHPSAGSVARHAYFPFFRHSITSHRAFHLTIRHLLSKAAASLDP